MSQVATPFMKVRYCFQAGTSAPYRAWVSASRLSVPVPPMLVAPLVTRVMSAKLPGASWSSPKVMIDTAINDSTRRTIRNAR